MGSYVESRLYQWVCIEWRWKVKVKATNIYYTRLFLRKKYGWGKYRQWTERESQPYVYLWLNVLLDFALRDSERLNSKAILLLVVASSSSLPPPSSVVLISHPLMKWTLIRALYGQMMLHSLTLRLLCSCTMHIWLPITASIPNIMTVMSDSY